MKQQSLVTGVSQSDSEASNTKIILLQKSSLFDTHINTKHSLMLPLQSSTFDFV